MSSVSLEGQYGARPWKLVVLRPDAVIRAAHHEHLKLPAELDYALLRAVATAPTDFFDAPDPDQLTAIYAQVARSITCANLDWPVRRP